MVWKRGGPAAVAALLTTLGFMDIDDVDPPIVLHMNEDEGLLSFWKSDADETLQPECAFYNGTVIYESSLCTHFVLSRSAATPATAFVRASKCMSHFDSECVLSSEIGLAVPAAFVPGRETGSVRMILAPRIVHTGGDARRVRVVDPSKSFSHRTLVFNSTISIEFLEGGTRAFVSEVFVGKKAFCVQLLRQAFAASCWENLER